jgi:3-hydroxybutyryl-CoA dehydrogenase
LRKQLVALDQELPPTVPLLCQCADASLTEAAAWLRHPERLVGLDGLFFSSGRVASLVASPTLTPQARGVVENFASSLGRLPIWISDSPALVLPRLIAMLANEAAFAVQEGVAEPGAIDLAMQLGVNYPKGPLSWASAIGYQNVVAILDHLRVEYGEERYRACTLLRRWARQQMINA